MNMVTRLKGKVYTNNSQVKNKPKFFPDKDSESEFNTFFKKLSNIKLKIKTTQKNLSHKDKP